MNYPYQKIFVIDDSEMDRYILSRVVNKCCFSKELIEFNMARKAINYLRENQNNETAPEIIFLDINMPEMNGFEFLESLNSFPESLKNQFNVVMLTSSNNPADSERAFKNPLVRGYLNKPINQPKLEMVLEQVKVTYSRGGSTGK